MKKKIKLDLTERQLVKEFAKKLMKESTPLIKQFSMVNKYKSVYGPNTKEYKALDTIHIGDDDNDWETWINNAAKNGINVEYDNNDDEYIVTNSRMAESKIIKENNTYTMVSALREITDDLLLQTELLIDKHYGSMDHNAFKNMWYKNANQFEKKFQTIIKSLMKAGK